MRHKIFAAIFLSIAIVTSSFAIKPKHLTITTREIAVLAPFKKILVDNYINVVLVQDPYRLTVTVSGDEKNVGNVQANVVNNRLTISSKKSLQNGKITVYIPVEDLSLLELSTGSSVCGEGILKLKDLTIVVSSGSHVNLNTVGEITITSADDCDFVYEKNERYKVLPAAAL